LGFDGRRLWGSSWLLKRGHCGP